MKEKLILTLWRAQLTQNFIANSIYCRLNYNNESKNSKNLQSKKQLFWKQTFIFPLVKEQIPLRIDFISLKKGQQIHFAKDNVAQTLSVAKALYNIPVKSATKGSLPAKIDIVDDQNNLLGKVFIEYQVLKTEVSYHVQKILDYNYLLKMSNFKVTFLRPLKNVPTFYLKFIYGEKTHRQDFAFNQQKGTYFYNYPVKLYLNKQIDLTLQLEVKQFFGLDYQSANQSIKSGSLTQRKSDFSTIGKRNGTLDLGFSNKITGVLELNFKQSKKTSKKISLTTSFKNQQRQIGSIEFQVETVFKTQQQKAAFEEQKRGASLKENPQNGSLQKKKKPSNANIKQSNGFIVLNTIMGKLQLNQQNSNKITDKNISLTLKLGKQIAQSSILENPGKQLIFLDTFIFKRTWQETIKFVIQVHKQNDLKIPTFFSSVNLRQLFEMGQVFGKKIKIYDDQKQYCGQFVLEMQYKEEQKKLNEKSLILQHKISQQQLKDKINQQKRQKIALRMKQREEQKKIKVQKKGSLSISNQRDILTMAEALDLKDLILPPLKSRKLNSESIRQNSRYSTLSPNKNDGPPQKFRSANIYNSNGGIRFTRSPRFDQNYENNKSGQSFTLVRQSDFDIKRKKGTFIGYGQKHDFTKDYKANPGIGKYSIPSLWDKYNGN